MITMKTMSRNSTFQSLLMFANNSLCLAMMRQQFRREKAGFVCSERWTLLVMEYWTSLVHLHHYIKVELRSRDKKEIFETVWRWWWSVDDDVAQIVTCINRMRQRYCFHFVDMFVIIVSAWNLLKSSFTAIHRFSIESSRIMPFFFFHWLISLFGIDCSTSESSKCDWSQSRVTETISRSGKWKRRKKIQEEEDKREWNKPLITINFSTIIEP
jgi:hypothetical protein